MSGYVVTIRSGPGTQIGGAALTAHTTIKNMDANNSVWLSSSRAVAPNNGIQLNPLASMQWIADALCFAVLDTGNVAPVNLNISDDVDQINDPLAIAIATSAQLLANGIPNVLVSDQLLSNTLLNNIGTQVDTHKYASVNVVLGTTPSNNATPQVIRFSWIDINGGVLDVGLLSSPFGGALAANSGQGGWQLPVMGQKLVLQDDNNTGHIVASVVGTNRIVPGKRLLNNFWPIRHLQCTFAAASPIGTTIQMFDTDLTVTNTGITSFNGAIDLNVVVVAPSVGVSGNLQMGTMDGSGTLQWNTVFQNTSTTDQRIAIAHPMGYCQWRYINSVVIGGAATNVDIFVSQQEKD